jgi:hypothetical protein
MARGQFSIFGAVEEKDRTCFPDSVCVKKTLNRAQLNCMDVVVRASRTVQRDETRTVGSRMSTGRAQEMQKGSEQ